MPILPNFTQINYETFPDLLKTTLSKHQKTIDNLLQSTHFTWENLMLPLETLEDELERLWSPVGHMHAVMNTPEIRKCYETCLPYLSAYETQNKHNVRLYKAIESIDPNHLTEAQKKIRQDCIRDFELSGIHLDNAVKKTLEHIYQELSLKTNNFETNILDAQEAFKLPIAYEAQCVGIPHAILTQAKEQHDNKFSLDAPTYQAILTFAEDRRLRETFYEAYTTRASDQGPHSGKFDNSTIMNTILALRDKKAKLLGFANYAEYSLKTKMASSPQTVRTFLQDLIERVLPKAKLELDILRDFANNELGITELKPWDVAFASEKRREKLFKFSEEDLRPYFPLPRVLQGLFKIVETLYGMRIKTVETHGIWHSDVFCIEIRYLDQLRGYIYLDLYARSGKRGGAWMDSCQTRHRDQHNIIQFPIAFLNCNFRNPTNDQPALLSHEELITLFHEFGHCLHHVLTQVEHLSASGIHGVEWDAVELPSQFFENWCWHEQTLNLLSKHYKTGEPLPHELYTQLIAAKNFHAALQLLRQLEFALFDFRLHQEYNSNDPDIVQKILDEIRSQTSLLPATSYNRFQHSFSHIFAGGYAAGYYSYLWAEILACDAFSRFEEEGILNPVTGKHFLNSILEVGSTQTAENAFKSFRGREASIEPFLRHHGI